MITAPTLLARLARALFDPDYVDPDGFVDKGRALFAAEMDHLEDMSLSRRIGGLLGNDLGQMRVQFNARTYVVEPVYRDDGLGLWDFGDQAQPQEDVVELTVEAARIERRDDADNPDRRRDEAEPSPNAVGRAREREPDERGPVIATYPEWDCDAGTEPRTGRPCGRRRCGPAMPRQSTPRSTISRRCGHEFDVWCAARKSDGMSD